LQHVRPDWASKVLADRGESPVGLGLGLGTVIGFDSFGDTVDKFAKSLDCLEHRRKFVGGAAAGHPRALGDDSPCEVAVVASHGLDGFFGHLVSCFG
jgi:hypothetical protein